MHDDAKPVFVLLILAGTSFGGILAAMFFLVRSLF